MKQRSKKLWSVLLTLALLMGLLPGAVLPAAADPVTVTDWADLASLLNGMQAGQTLNVRLDNKITPPSADTTALVVKAETEVTIDLNGNAIIGYYTDSHSTAPPLNCIICVCGDLTISDSDNDGGGWIDGGDEILVDGGSLTLRSGTIGSNNVNGVRIQHNGAFTMYGGKIIMNRDIRSGSYDPGGRACVRVEDGTFTMNGGSLECCRCDNDSFMVSDCSGVVVNSGAFSFYGGTISGSHSDSDYRGNCGVVVGSGVDFTMGGNGKTAKISGFQTAGVQLTGGRAELSGGAYITGCDTGLQLTGVDAYITGDDAYITGCDTGVQMNGGSLDISGGHIANCKDGVWQYGGALSMSGGYVQDCGYGINVMGGDFTLTGGTIQDCGCGVNAIAGTFTIPKKSTAVIQGNGTGGGEGVRVSCTFRENGAYFVRCNAQMAGGTIRDNAVGVKVDGGVFTLSGGDIEDNEAGVVLYYGNTDDAVFYMTGGAISGSAASGSEVGVAVECGKAYITGGDVSGNKVGVGVTRGSAYLTGGSAYLTGGDVESNEVGVWVKGGAADIGGDCEIYWNKKAGVRITDGELTIGGKSCIYRNHTAGIVVQGGKADLGEESFVMFNEKYGVLITGGDVTVSSDCYILSHDSAGIVVAGGRAEVTGGWISGNNSDGKGVGLGVIKGTLALSGGEVEGNNAGVAVAAPGVLLLSGAPVFRDNDVADLALSTGCYVTLPDTLHAKNLSVKVQDPPAAGERRLLSHGLQGRGGADTFVSRDKGYHVEIDETSSEAYLVADDAKPNNTVHYSSGGSKTYKITVAATEHGAAAASKSTAAEGEKITVTATPDEGYELEAITAKDAKGNTVTVTNGKFTMTAADVTVTVTFKEKAFVNPYVDVHEGDYFYEPVMWAKQNDITNGTDATHFSPNNLCTRAETVTFLWRAEGSPEPNTTVNPFEDVSADAYYYKAVLWAVENGVTKGTDEAHFSPDAPTTREQYATFLYRCAQSHGKGFTGMWSFRLAFPDAGDVSDWAYEAMCWMVMNGVVNGMDGRLNPQGNAVRAHVVSMLYRYQNLA